MELNTKAFVTGISLLVVIIAASGNGQLASIVILGCLILLIFWAARWFNAQQSKQKIEEHLEALRKEIGDYRPGKLTRRDVGENFQFPEKAVLGVFGAQDSGKSTCLNSLLFAYTGKWEMIYTEGERLRQGGESLFRDPRKLTENIVLLDNRGMVDLSPSNVDSVMEQIHGARGLDPRTKNLQGMKVSCPVFVFKYSRTTGIEHCRDFAYNLAKKIKMDFGSYPIMLITFAESIQDQKEIIDNIVSYGMERHSIYAVENYTVESHDEDLEKHIMLLEILKACLQRADDNIAFRGIARKEPAPNYNCIVS